MDPEEAVCRALDGLNIAYTRFVHPPVYTVAQARQYDSAHGGVHAKNLFLRNRKGNRHYLLVAPESLPVDLKALSARLGDPGLGLASPERLMSHLGVEPGAVGPFGLIHEEQRQVTVLVEASLPGADAIGFHPNLNTATLMISGADLMKFLSRYAERVEVIDFSQAGN